MAISFKNAGFKQYDIRRIESVEVSKIPIGIKTPLSFGLNGEGFYTMNFTVADQIQDNFKNLLLTNHGERIGRYFYGANLQPLVVEFTTKQNDFETEAITRINTAVSVWMPFIQLIDFDYTPIYDNDQFIIKMGITVTYSVPEVQVFNKKIQVILYVT
jgi:phage baseplate assembly protein W